MSPGNASQRKKVAKHSFKYSTTEGIYHHQYWQEHLLDSVKTKVYLNSYQEIIFNA